MATNKVPWKAQAMRDGLISGRDETLERAGFTGRTQAPVRPYVPCWACPNPVMGGEWHYCWACMRYGRVPEAVVNRELSWRGLLRAVDQWPEDSMLKEVN